MSRLLSNDWHIWLNDNLYLFLWPSARVHLTLSPFLSLHPTSLPQLSISEEDVWRVVVRWGQRYAGIKQTNMPWSATDQSKIQEALQGVLEHVRIMEINSEVFAKEVEPTGLLPVEMTLARYRQAAMRKKGNCVELSRPRSGIQEPFIDSAILTGRADLQMQINEW